jgi:uncharacterized protein (TIGR00725 family)
MKRLQIAVIGLAACDAETREVAKRVGRAIAQAGAILLSGGLGGVMEAASQGAKEAGGLVIGVLPQGERHAGNQYLDVEIVTNLGHARNVLLAHSADALIAVRGGYGTLSEIAIALKLGKPVVGYKTWEIDGVLPAADPDEAVQAALAQLHSKGRLP